MRLGGGGLELEACDFWQQEKSSFSTCRSEFTELVEYLGSQRGETSSEGGFRASWARTAVVG